MYRHKSKKTLESKQKDAFRRTKTWTDFRLEMFDFQDGKDYITKSKLHKGWNLHHANLEASAYQNLNKDDFFCLGSQCHDFVHWLYKYYRKDKKIIFRLKEVLERMYELSEKQN